MTDIPVDYAKRRCIIGAHGRTYSDDEFAMILAKAAELSAHSSLPDGTSRGLSLVEMKTIAEQVGLDPELIERAAHLVPGVSRSTLMVRVAGGPLSSQLEFVVPVRLTLDGAQQLLSLVRATLLTQGRGEATAAGMSFSSFEAWRKVFVSAHADGDGTRIRVVVDNRSRLVMPVVLASLGTMIVVSAAAGGGVEPTVPGATVLPYLVFGGGMATGTGLLWRSIRKTAQSTL